MFARLHGPLPHDFAVRIESCSYFELFVPTRRPVQLPRRHAGLVHVDGRRHPNCVVIPCFRPHPLGNPWPIRQGQSLSDVCRLFELLIFRGGSPQQYGGFVDSRYARPEADALRESELARITAFVLAGGSVELRCCNACVSARRIDPSRPCHTLSLAAAIEARLQQALASRASAPPPSYTFAVYGSRQSTVFRLSESHRLPARMMHVRRACPPVDVCAVEFPAVASPRMRRALLSASSSAPFHGDAAEAVQRAQPFAFAGAIALPSVDPLETPAPFSHRRLERRPDLECLLAPLPVTNVPPVMPFEDPPPADPPLDLVATDVREVVPHNDLHRFQAWARRADRSITLARSGDRRAARSAKPDDLMLTGVMPRFAGVVMDFTVFPFRPLLPSRWPDRPPSTDLRIRLIRREFRAHRDYPDRNLRGSMSHGVPEVGPCSRVSFFAAPHGSAYAHCDTWLKQMASERSRGWGRAGFDRSFGLATWPQRCQPTSMVLRHGNWRLCHDLSWPLPDNPFGVESPNDADELVMVMVFAVLSQLCAAAALFLAAGLPCREFKFDLTKAYKRNGTQRSSTWRRTTWSEHRSQTLDRICFGQRDGPCSFSGSTHFMVAIMRAELAYAEACYPCRCPHVVAYVRLRLLLAREARAADERPWTALSFIMAMLDDFGGVAVDYPVFRVDGSAVCDSRGVQQTFAFLALEICENVVYRFGHSLEKEDPLKYALPCVSMLLLGGIIDLSAEELVFDDDKRGRYLAALRSLLASGGCTAKELTSMAFRLLCVCECEPQMRHCVDPLFRALRHSRTSRVLLEHEPEVAQALRRFEDRLADGERIAIPLACRQSFPFADSEHLLVCFADASGPEPFDAVPSSSPGFGAWMVRGRTLYLFDGLWSADELRLLHISVLEFVVSFWAPQIFLAVAPAVSHVLEFTDNTGAEFSMRRETPHALLMQRVAGRRAAFLAASGLFARVCRVQSAVNAWADHLSRQRRSLVLAEAAALGLTVEVLAVPAELRDLSWLLA
jgi:hypothetical protein